MKVIPFILGSVICFLIPITVVNFVIKYKVENELVNLKHKYDELKHENDELSKKQNDLYIHFDDINTKYLILRDENKKLKTRAGLDALINGGKVRE